VGPPFENGPRLRVYLSAMRNHLFPVLAASLLVAPHAGSAQSERTIDEGSFTITVNGQRTGRETFTILAEPRGDSWEQVARGTLSYGDTLLTPRLNADPTGSAVAYQIETRNSRDSWKGTIMRGRVSARIRSDRGESEKEYIVTDGALILDDGVYHQYYFIPQRTTNGSVAVLIPRRNTQLRLKVTAAGNERLTVGTRELDARHFVLTEPDGARRDLWVDSQGRVLKVAVPARGIVAMRDDPPA
jgi:hypothetical protein